MYLNLCILLAIDSTYNAGLFNAADFKQYSREFLEKFQALLKRDTSQGMNIEEEGTLSDSEKDRIIIKVIEVIFEKKKNRIKVLDGDIEKLESDYHKLSDEDLFLKSSVLSYLLFMKMNTNNPSDIHVITKESDNIMNALKKSKLTKKLQEIIATNLHFNKTISLLLRGKFQDIKDLELSNDQWDNLAIKAFVYTKNKKVEAVEELTKEMVNHEKKDKFLINLLQIGSFHLLNNQNLYLDKFVSFMNQLVLPEYKQSSGAFSQETFREFFAGVVKYIFRNAGLLTQMKDSVKDLVANFDDVEVLHNIAENFAAKKDYASSEDVYRRILQIEPDNEKARRKGQHFLAMRDPAKVKYEDLPPITLITENEELRKIEVDFLKYKASVTRATSKSWFNRRR